jgi:hypothetical protein
MRLKINISTYLLFSLFLFFSCSQEDKFENYKLFIRNNTNQVIELVTFENGTEIDSVLIEIGERGLECSFEEISFAGYGRCSIDSIKFIFPNGKGYLCSIGDDESLCFGNENAPWYFNDKFVDTSSNIYEFTINQEDYENANDLP